MVSWLTAVVSSQRGGWQQLLSEGRLSFWEAVITRASSVLTEGLFLLEGLLITARACSGQGIKQ